MTESETVIPAYFSRLGEQSELRIRTKNTKTRSAVMWVGSIETGWCESGNRE